MNSNSTVKKILVLAANPKQTGRLRLDEEVRDIKEGLRLAQKRDQFLIEQEWAVRPRDIRRAILNYRPNIIHFSGHGSGAKGLYFEDETGNPQLVTGEALAGLFEQFAKQIECVLLNACYAQMQADVIVQHIDYVIGMNDSIDDKAAIEFAVGFYDGLATHNPEYDEATPVEFAFAMGCNAIALAGVSGESIPVLKKKTNLATLDNLINVPDLPLHFLPRPEHLETLKQEVLGNTNKPVVITGMSRRVGVQGMGGIGKTVLATALARDEEVRQAFSDGVLWVTLGQTPQLLSLQTELAKVLGDSQAVFTEIGLGKTRLRELLADKACLLILDDIWQREHAEAFDVLGERCQMLITTRDAAIITDLGAKGHELTILSEAQALSLLGEWTNQAVDISETAREVARECGYLPLALAMIGARLRDNPKNRWDNVLQKLRNADLEKIRQQFPDYPYPDLLKAIQVSVEALEPDVRQRYLDFAVFPEDTLIPEVLLQTLWEPEGLDEFDTQDVVDELVNKSLMLRNDKAFLGLHDLQFDYLRKQTGNLSVLHNRLLNAYAQKCVDGWHTGVNDGYFFQNLAYHLHEGGRVRKLQRLLLDFRWLEAKLEKTNINALLADYDFLPEYANVQLVQGALRLSAHVLNQDKTELATQLWGRLQSVAVPEIQAILEQAKQWKATPWLRLLTPCLTRPGGALLRTLSGHNNEVRAIVLTPDGKYVISGSLDGTLKVWNWQTGEEVRTLRGHYEGVWAVALTPDGKYVISGSGDHTLKIWNWRTGEEVRTLKKGHSSTVKAVAVTPDNKYIISGSWDKTLNVWDWQTGELVRTLTERSRVNAIVVTPDSKYVISGSWDNTLKVWNWQTGELVRTLEGDNEVRAIALTPDGKYVISESWGKTLKVWNWQTGEVVRTLDISVSHAVAVTPDGKYLISGSAKGNLKVWDWQTGEVVRTLSGHSDQVNALVVTPDGKCIISGSSDKTLKVWNWQIAQEVHTSTAHSYDVKAVGVTPDGKYAISGSLDKTLKVWNWQTGEEVRTLTDDSGEIEAAAFTPDGKYLISGSWDKTLKVWNWQTGEVVRTLKGHSHWVNAVAVTRDGKYIISGSADETLKVWDWQTGEEVRTLEYYESWGEFWGRAVAVTRDGECLIYASYNKLCVWNWQFSNNPRILNTEDVDTNDDSSLILAALFRMGIAPPPDHKDGHSSSIETLCLTPDDKYIISGSHDKTLKVWDFKTGEVVRTLQGHNDKVKAVALSPNGKYVISGSDDNTLKVWNWQTGELIASFTGDREIECCTVAPDGMTIVAGEKSGKVYFLRLERAKE